MREDRAFDRPYPEIHGPTDLARAEAPRHGADDVKTALRVQLRRSHRDAAGAGETYGVLPYFQTSAAV